jgi:ATP-dependent helicase/nuclease subunit B
VPTEQPVCRQMDVMAKIDTAPLPLHLSVTELWLEVARCSNAWLQRHDLAARDAVVLLPYAALLPQARAAFAAAAGWQPRIETALTLAATLGPPRQALPGELSGDAVLDRLSAATMLRAQPWARDWARRDARGFDHLVQRVCESAWTLADTAAAIAPTDRPTFWAKARQTVAAQASAAVESALLSVALEWAALSPAPAPVADTDRLFSLAPAAWIALRIGGADPLVDAVLAASACPALRLDADPPADDPFSGTHACELTRTACQSIEDEAQACAAELIAAINQGQRPLALVVLDRILTRRVRVLLTRAGATLSDETGWRLSTTPAAARVMAVLRAAAPQASRDDLLAWLKLDHAHAPWLQTLEALWRKARISGSGAEVAQASAAATHAVQREREGLAPLAGLASRGRASVSLLDWLQALQQVLAPWATDADMALVQQALRLGESGPAWLAAARAMPMQLPELLAWVDQVLDAGNVEPLRDADADVVITPLSRAIGRPFAKCVVPGANEARLGAANIQPSLISETLAQQLGLDNAAMRQQRERLALAQLLRAPHLGFIRRRLDGDAPLGASPWVSWMAASVLNAAGQPPGAEREWAADTAVMPLAPVQRPQPTAADRLPIALSASSILALRECPYRFFARSVLRLAEHEEIAAPLEKRDYGNWLHLALFRFHAQGPGNDPAQQLRECAKAAGAELALDAAELLPFEASFEVFVPRYVAWWRQRRQQGWQWQAGEIELSAEPPALAPQRLKSRLDRVDQHADGALEVIDYKTGSAESMKKRVREPLEDTQLAVYAALLMHHRPEARSVAAHYLTLDDATSPQLLQHPEVATSAKLMIEGLAQDFAALRAGAAMPALGEGPVCETCEARGLCRRDHWPALAGTPA